MSSPPTTSEAVNGKKVNPEDLAPSKEEIEEEIDDEDISSEESEEEDIADDEVPVATIATTRPKRANAGAKMASLINNSAEKDAFYQTAYGGFTEDADDGDFDKEKAKGEEAEEEEEIEEDETDDSVVSQEEAATNA